MPDLDVGIALTALDLLDVQIDDLLDLDVGIALIACAQPGVHFCKHHVLSKRLRRVCSV